MEEENEVSEKSEEVGEIDIDALEVPSREEIDSFSSKYTTYPGDNLTRACFAKNPQMLKYFLEAKGQNGKLLYDPKGDYKIQSALPVIFDTDQRAYRQRYHSHTWHLSPFGSRPGGYYEYMYNYGGGAMGGTVSVKYGERYAGNTADEEFIDHRLVDKIMNKHACMRLVLRNAKNIYDDPADILNEWSKATGFEGPLQRLAMSGPACVDVKVIIEELGAKNIKFDNWNRRVNPSFYAGQGGNFKLFEVYLTEYLKMQYAGEENESFYNELLNYLTANKDLLVDAVKMFPKNLAHAMEDAKADLGEDLDAEKLKTVTNELEAKIMPDVYVNQKAQNKTRGNWALLLAIPTVGISLIWYAYHRSREPIKARETNVGAYDKYLSRKNIVLEDDITSSGETSISGEYILERIKKKEPVKEKERKPGKPVEWRTHKVAKLSDEDNKITIFSSRYNDQAKKFNREIWRAEREVRRER